MSSTDIDFTKLFHQLSLTDTKNKSLYAQAIIRLESLKKKSDPIAMAHAYQISFVRVAAEIKEKLELIENHCDLSKKLLSKYERSSTESMDSMSSEGSTSSAASELDNEESADDADIFTQYIQEIEDYIENIKTLIDNFNRSQRVILNNQLNIDELVTQHGKIYALLYENKGEIEEDAPKYKIMLDKLYELISVSKKNLPTLGIKLFPVPKSQEASTSKGGKKKNKNS